MEIFKSLKSILKLIGILDWKLPPPFHRVPLTLILRVCFLGLMSLSSLTSFGFFLFEAKGIYDKFESFLHSIGSLLLFIWYSITLYYREKIAYFLNTVQEKIEKRMTRTNIIAVKLEYLRINGWIERQMQRLRIIYFQVYVPLFVIPLSCYNLYKYISTNYAPESLQLIICASFPYNWQTLHGYLFTWIFQFAELISMVAFGYGFLSFFGGFCTFLVSFVEDIQEHIIDLNDDIKSHQNGDNTHTHFQLRMRFCKVIKFHAECIELVQDFSHFCSKFTLIFFIVDGIVIVTVLLQLNTALDSGDPVDIIRSTIILCSALLWIYIFCHFGNKVTSAYEKLSTSIYMCDWYLYPIEMQKYLKMMILLAQRTVYIRAFGSINCSFETFKEILLIAYKIFMVLKELIN